MKEKFLKLIKEIKKRELEKKIKDLEKWRDCYELYRDAQISRIREEIKSLES